jgi:hypothetical protein
MHETKNQTAKSLITRFRQIRNLGRRKTPVAGVLLFGLLWVGLATAILLLQSEQDIRQEASTDTTQTVLFSLKPSYPSSSQDQSPWLENWDSLTAGQSIQQLLQPEYLPAVSTTHHQFDIEAVIHGPDLNNDAAAVGMTLALDYDKNLLEFVSENTAQHPLYSVRLSQVVGSSSQTSKETVELSIGRNPEIEVLPTVIIPKWSPARFTFKFKQSLVDEAIKSGSPIHAVVRLLPTKTVVVGADSAANLYTYQRPVSLKVSFIPTIPPTTGNFKMQVTLAGVPVENNPSFLKEAKRQPLVQVKAYGVQSLSETATQVVQTQFTTVSQPSATNPHYFQSSGFALANLSPGKYQFLIKGPLHQQMRICQQNQPKDYVCQPNEGIDITAAQLTSDFNLDAKSRPLMCGDLPISGSNKTSQDGKVNSQDYSFALGCLSKRNDPACVAKADCDGDGVITNRDMNLLLNTLSVAYDQ